MSLRHLHTLQSLKEGWLQKSASSKGEDVFRGNWQKRYFRLYSDRLEYYKRAEDNTPAGVVDLRAALISPVEASQAGGAQWVLRVAEARQVFLYVAAEGAVERDQWLRAMRRCAGVEESLSATIASAAEADLRSVSRVANQSAWGCLSQTVADLAPPTLSTIVLGTDGAMRLYNSEARLELVVDGGQVVRVESSGRADAGIGVGPHWRMLVPVSVTIKLHSATSGDDAPKEIGYNFFFSTEEECASFLPLLRSLSRNDLLPIKAHAEAVVLQTGVEVYDASFRSGWSSKYAVLTRSHLLLFANSNDPSSYRSLFLHAAQQLDTEGALGLNLSRLLEKEPLTLKFAHEAQRDEWKLALGRLIGAAARRAQEARDKVEAEQARIEAEERRKREQWKPLKSVSGEFAPAPRKLTLSDLDSSSTPAPAPATAEGSKGLLSFAHPSGSPLESTDACFVLNFGCGASGQLGHRNTLDILRPTPLESLRKPVRSLSAGSSHAAFVTSQGHVHVTGSCLAGLGLGERMLESKAPLLLTALLRNPIRSVVCGTAHTLALDEQGGVHAWGANQVGQCGLGHRNAQFYPAQVESLRGRVVLRIAAGGEHSGAIVASTDGSDATDLYTWGNNSTGCLGVGSTDSHSLPVPNAGLAAKGVHPALLAFGGDFSLVVSREGRVYACGGNAEGQQGMGDRNRRSVFVELAFFSSRSLRAFAVAAGRSHGVVLALNEQGSAGVYAFGAAVANGFREAQPAPMLLPALTSPAGVFSSPSSGHTLVVSAAGRAFSFGANGFGELGNGVAGVEAMVRLKLPTGTQAHSAATGGGFSMLLCRGEAPAASAVPQPPSSATSPASASSASSSIAALAATPQPAASNASPPPPSQSESKEIKQTLGMQGSNATGPDFNAALDQITRLLQMEASMAPGGLANQLVQIERGEIDLLHMQSLDKPTAAPATSAAPASAAIPSAAAANPSQSQPQPAKPQPAPFKFTLASTANVPIPAAPVAPPPAAASDNAMTGTTASSSAKPAPATGAVGGIAAKIAALQAAQAQHAAAPPSQVASFAPAAMPLYNVAAALSPQSGASVAATAAVPAPAASTPDSKPKEKERKEKAPLPPGWRKVKDPASGRSYYFHEQTKAVTWKRPKPEAEAQAEAMPPPPPPPEDPEDPLPPPPPASVDDALPPPPPPAPADEFAPPPPPAPIDGDDEVPPPPPPQ